MTAQTPTRKTVELRWNSYRRLALVVASDPLLASDRDQLSALRRAHARWQQVYDDWCTR